MSDKFQIDKIDDDVKSFADLLDSYEEGMNEDIKIGDKVKGEIISIGMDAVFVNTGAKIDGAVDKAELLDDDGNLPCEVGDMLELYVVSLDDNEIRLSKALSGVGGINMLRDAYENMVPVEGKVVEECKGGFRVELFQRRAFCPVSQIDTRYVETPADYVGQVLTFQVTRFESNGKNIVVSRRELLMKEQEAEKAKFLETVKVGSVVEGRVTNIMSYGVFVELFPGLEGMCHISEMSWSRLEKPEEVVAKDDSITVKIIDMKEGDKPGSLKVGLSMKQISGDPWDSDEELFKPGDVVRGKITRLMNFGAFAEIHPGMEGLVHISEMSYKKRVLNPEEIVKAGDVVDVMIKDIDRANRRISLSIKDAEGDPWVGARDRYPLGKVVQGTIQKKEKFGYFITIEQGITGLLPKSKISKYSNPSSIEKLKEGESITVNVVDINTAERKITLAPGDSKEAEDWRNYSGKSSSSSLGSLGEKLQQALNSKK